MTLRFTRRALRPLEEVRAYIGQHDPHAGNRVIAQIEEAVSGLTLYPRRGRPGRIPDTWELIVSRHALHRCLSRYRRRNRNPGRAARGASLARVQAVDAGRVNAPFTTGPFSGAAGGPSARGRSGRES